MSGFLLLKRSVGNKYEAEVGVLSRVDRYLVRNYPAITGLPKESVTGWCAKQPHEKPANQCSRASVIRQFAKYLDSTGHRAYILPDNYYPSGFQYVPHIYTQDELVRFFAETDTCHFCSECPWRHVVLPVFFPERKRELENEFNSTRNLRLYSRFSVDLVPALAELPPRLLKLSFP